MKKYFCLLLLVGSQCFAQEKWNLTAGFGLPEFFNLGARYQLDQKQLGINFGMFPDASVSATGDFYIHFGGSSKYNERKPWYVRNSISYIYSDSEYSRSNSVFFTPRIGREINFSSKFGLAVDAGLTGRLYEKEKVKKPRNSSFISFDDIPIIPSFGLNLFYRL